MIAVKVFDGFSGTDIPLRQFRLTPGTAEIILSMAGAAGTDQGPCDVGQSKRHRPISSYRSFGDCHSSQRAMLSARLFMWICFKIHSRITTFIKHYQATL